MARDIIQEILDQYLQPINATTVIESGPPPDLSPWEDDDLPCGSHLNKNDEYFWHHHAPGKKCEGPFSYSRRGAVVQ